MNDVLHVFPTSLARNYCIISLKQFLHPTVQALSPTSSFGPLLDHGTSVAADAVRMLLGQGAHWYHYRMAASPHHLAAAGALPLRATKLLHPPPQDGDWAAHTRGQLLAAEPGVW